MAIGREAARDQLATALLTGTTSPHALPASLERWNRHDTSQDNLTRVFFTLTWEEDSWFAKQSRTGTTGNRRIVEFSLSLVLLTFMAQDIVENGLGTPGALGEETAEDRLMGYWEAIQERLNDEAHWSAGTTGIFDVSDLRKAGNGPVVDRMLTRRFRMTVRVDLDLS